MASAVANGDPRQHIAGMTKAASLAQKTPKKRGKGRPVAGENDVGRERLLIATEKLLRTNPPARVTTARVAQEANVDPALVRYYFGDRTSLLIAVVDRVTAHAERNVQGNDRPADALADHIARTVELVRRAPFMHRLVIDELAQAGSDQSRARVRAMNLDLVEFYRNLLRADDGKELAATDPLFLHIAVLGASDFFSSAELLIRELLPDDTDWTELTARFQTFLVELFLNGLRKR